MSKLKWLLLATLFACGVVNAENMGTTARSMNIYDVQASHAKCDGTTDDSKAIDDWLNNSVPAGANILFPSGKTCMFSYPMQHLKAGQKYNLNGAILKFLPVRTTTTAGITYGTGSAAVADRTNFKCGQRVIIVTSARTLGNVGSALTIVGTAGPTDCTPATGAGTLYFDVGVTGQNIAFDGSGSGTVTVTSPAVVTNAGMFFDSAKNTSASDIEIAHGIIDGSRSATLSVSVPRWEADAAIHLVDGQRANVHDLTIKETDSEGIVIGGDGSRVANIVGVNIGGNLIHWGVSDGATANNISCYGCNLGGELNGHADGMMTFSLGTNHASFSNFFAYNAKRLFGAAKGFGGSYVNFSNMTGIGMNAGPFQLTYGTVALTGDVSNGSATIANVKLSSVLNVHGVNIGDAVSGTGLTNPTYVTGIDYVNSALTISPAATGGTTGEAITVNGPARYVAINNVAVTPIDTSTYTISSSSGTFTNGTGQITLGSNAKVSAQSATLLDMSNANAFTGCVMTAGSPTVTNCFHPSATPTSGKTMQMSGLVDISGSTSAGTTLDHITLSGISVQNTRVSFQSVDHLNVSALRVSNPTDTGGKGLYGLNLTDTNIEVDIYGSHRGIDIGGSGTRNVHVTGRVRDQGGSETLAAAVSVASGSLPTTQELHFDNLYVQEENIASVDAAVVGWYIGGSVDVNGGETRMAKGGRTFWSYGSDPYTVHDHTISDATVATLAIQIADSVKATWDHNRVMATNTPPGNYWFYVGNATDLTFTRNYIFKNVSNNQVIFTDTNGSNVLNGCLRCQVMWNDWAYKSGGAADGKTINDPVYLYGVDTGGTLQISGNAMKNYTTP